MYCSLCNLIHEIPQLNYTEAYPQLINDVVARLWFYVLHSENCEMMEAALNGLTSFSLEQISSHFPDEYLDADTLESKQNNAASQIVPGLPLQLVFFNDKCEFILRQNLDLSLEIVKR